MAFKTFSNAVVNSAGYFWHSFNLGVFDPALVFVNRSYSK